MKETSIERLERVGGKFPKDAKGNILNNIEKTWDCGAGDIESGILKLTINFKEYTGVCFEFLFNQHQNLKNRIKAAWKFLRKKQDNFNYEYIELDPKRAKEIAIELMKFVDYHEKKSGLSF